MKALARAIRYQRLLDEGPYASISEVAAAERMERGYLGSLVRLALLAPEIVEAILNGRQSGRGASPDGGRGAYRARLPRHTAANRPEPIPSDWLN
jgi:hypothetical protein